MLPTGVAVRVIEGGASDAPVVVLVHGWGVHSHLWKRTAPALLAAGLRVVAVDLPGHGLSERPSAPGSFTLDAMTAHLHGVFDVLGVTRGAIVAQSMGGRVATEFALREPARVASLALFGSVGFGDVPATVALTPYLPAPRGPLTTVLVQRWMVALSKAWAYGRRTPVLREDIDAYWAPTQFPDFVPAMHQALVEFDWRPLPESTIARIAAPTLVVFGTRDRTVRPHRAAERTAALPHGALYMVTDAGHVANEEAPDEVNPVLVEFISRHR